MTSSQNESTVLIVDDNAEHRELIASLLMQAGFAVLSAETASQGVKIALAEVPELIISDVVMPGGSGIDLCREIRSNEGLRSIPILLISGLDRKTASVVEALKAGADDYMEMPIEPHRLVAKVARLIERKKFEDSLERQVAERTSQLTAANRKLQEEFEDRKRAEETLRQTEERLIQAQKMEAIGTLAGGVAHDFNNLLTAILGNAQLLLQSMEEHDPRRARIVEIEKAGNRGSTLTRQMLAFSRRQRLERRTISLNDTIAGTIRMLERIIGADVEISESLSPDLARVFADPAQIEQVLINLAVNARDAMPHGGHLEVKTSNVVLDEIYTRQHPYVEAGCYVEVLVSDTGSGMDPETMGRIFEPFFTTKEVGKGTGLGLSTVYGIVKQHGGHINVYSEKGHGTAFRVFFPADEKSLAAEPPRAQAPFSGGNETILVAEDEEALRILAKDVLEDLGYTVLLANDGKVAVEIFREYEQSIDLLLLDLVMPRVGGLEAYQLISEIQPDVPMILMTGYSSETVQGRFAGRKDRLDLFDGLIIQKPYSIETLGRGVREALDAHVPSSKVTT